MTREEVLRLRVKILRDRIAEAEDVLARMRVSVERIEDEIAEDEPPEEAESPAA